MAAGLGVQSCGRFVQEKHQRVVDQRSCDGKPLLLAAGKLLEHRLGPLFQFDLAEEAPRVHPPVVQAPKHVQYLGETESVEERG